ncbi:MAG: TonB family protein [Thermoanaerobaculia bacterium]
MFGVEEKEEEAETGRLLPGLRAAASESNFARSPRLASVPTPRIDEIVERIEHPQRRFPVERAILISLILHVLLLAFLLLHPPGSGPVRRLGETDQERVARESREAEFRVPIRMFTEAPGPSRPNPSRNAPPSDKTRRAGGGDRAKPPAETPFVAQKQGIEGLRPGPQGKREASSTSARTSPQTPTPSVSPSAATPQPGQAAEKNPSGVTMTPGAPQHLPNLNRAIQAAAGNPFSGQGGAPNPNENGGFVDSGPISFDTQWYDWGDYAEEMIRRIKLHWEVPELARLGVKGKLSIRFYIRADGTVEGEKILRDSTIPPYDHAAFQAIATSSPFRPLPKDLHEDREGVTITFFYNIRPSEEGKPR